MANNPPPASRQDIARYKRNYRDEVDGVRLYQLLADAEDDPHLQDLYNRLSETEVRHRDLWARKLREAGVEPPSDRASLRVRMLGFLARRFGTAFVSPIVTRMEQSATTMYDDQPEAVEAHLPADERSHARLFRQISSGSRRHRSGVDIARIEGRHRGASGNAIRAAVLGANDGLVSNLSLVAGVAGADPDGGIVILAGVAGLLAGSLSMALGEWVSVRSSAEYFENQLAIERDELAEIPEEEEEELVLIYQAQGMDLEQARATAARVMSDPELALQTLAREELGMSEDADANPWVAGGVSFVMFAIGAVLPVLPWLVTEGVTATLASVILSGIGLFLLGALITFFTGRGALFSGTRMLVLGLAAAAITYGIGAAIGVGI
ncbi:MAG: VIT1/CCC1 transporter family protein [Dehalococcoidia bacterium]